MALSKSSCPPRDGVPRLQGIGDGTEQTHSCRRPSDNVRSWVILACVIVCIVQFDARDELSAPYRRSVNRRKRDVSDVTGRTASTSRRTGGGERYTRRSRAHRRYVTREDLAKALKSLNSIIDEDLHTSFHVVPLLDKSDDEDVTTSTRVLPLRWTRRSPLTHMTGFELASDRKTVEVKVSGTYFMYSQVTYNGRGRHGGLAHPPCSHLLMLKPYGLDATGRPKGHVKLLYSVTTQHGMGLRSVHPYDSVFMAGVFHLEPGDRLYVRPGMRSVGCRFMLHPEKTFFGVFRLNPTVKSPY